MKIKILIFAIFYFLIASINKTKAQNTVITDDNAYTPHSSAILDVKSISKGLLLPRLTTTQRVSIPSPADGLVVYDTDMKAIYVYRSSYGWLNALSASLLWESSGNNMYPANNSAKIGIGTNSPTAKLTIVGDAGGTVNDTLFVVRNKDGEPVFAVFPEGVQVWMEDGAKGNAGGFAISGRSSSKTVNEYFRVTTDSTRIYVNTSAKGNAGGFAVSGRSSSKNISRSFLFLEPENYFIGHEAGIKTTGHFNSFFGYHSGQNNEGGQYNVFMGYKSGQKNTSGSNNVFIGNEAGLNNTTGFLNTFIGYNAGKSNTEGYRNVFIGNEAGLSNTTGYLNTFVGNVCGDSNTTGAANTFVGNYSGYNNKTGQENVFIGQSAGNGNISGSNNIYIGRDAGYYGKTGVNNTYIGYFAGYNDTSSSNNVFLGTVAGYNVKSGTKNVFIGPGAGYSETVVSNKLIIANQNNKNLIEGDFNDNIVTINNVLRIIPTPTAPLNPIEGQIYINSNNHHIFCYLNGAWKQLD